MDIEEAASRLLRTEESGFSLIDLEESTEMDIEENQYTPIEIEEAASRQLRTDESGSMLVSMLVNVEESTEVDIEENESAPMNRIEEAASRWRDRDACERATSLKFVFLENIKLFTKVGD